MSQLPQNNEEFDYNPEYAKLYQTNDSSQSDADDMDEWQQPASELPSEVQGEQDGQRAANSSLLCGFLSPLSFFLAFWLLVQGHGENGALQLAIGAPLLNVLGIWQGFVAKRHGVPALAGPILSWAGAIFTLPLAIVSALFSIALAGSI